MFVVVIAMLKVGAPGVGTTEMRAQKPPTMPYLPPVIAVPASCWPDVALMTNSPLVPVLVAPPPAARNQLS